MADLVTHLSSVLLPAAFLPRRFRPWAGVLATGVILPDVAAHVPAVAVDVLQTTLDGPAWWSYPFAVAHTPAGMLLICGILAHFFVKEQQRRVFLWLLAGATAHLALDLTQDHHDMGYYLFVPFELTRFELGWIGSEATVPWALPLALGTAAAWGVTKVTDGRRQVSSDSGGEER